MENKPNTTQHLGKDYVRASGMVMRVGKAVLGLVLFNLAKMGKVLVNQVDKTGLPSSTGQSRKNLVKQDPPVDQPVQHSID